MTIGATELLRKLAGGAGVNTAQAVGPLNEAASFAGLLAKAAAGPVPESGIPVTVEPFAGVELTEEQLERVARAADAAERDGATRALLIVDNQLLMFDVTSRTVTGKADTSAQVLTGIDAVVRVPPAGAVGGGSVLGMPGNGVLGLSPSLLSSLSESTDPRED